VLVRWLCPAAASSDQVKGWQAQPAPRGLYICTAAGVQEGQRGAAAAALGQPGQGGLGGGARQHHPAQGAHVARRQPLLEQEPATGTDMPLANERPLLKQNVAHWMETPLAGSRFRSRSLQSEPEACIWDRSLRTEQTYTYSNEKVVPRVFAAVCRGETSISSLLLPFVFGGDVTGSLCILPGTNLQRVSACPLPSALGSWKFRKTGVSVTSPVSK
jgi:hypothetical protein